MNSFNRWITLGIVSSALCLIVIDMTVLYTALPSLTYDLEVSASEKLWILNIYSLLMAGLLPGLGTLGDRVGHKRMFMTGLVIFGIASICAAYSPSAYFLISSRALLAVGAAMMMPATLSIIRLTFTDESERSIAIGIWSAVASGSAALGPLVGGFLLEYFWWGSVFLINIPVVITAFILTLYVIPNFPGNPKRQWDLIASVYILIGLIGITMGIKEFSNLTPTYPLVAFSFIGGGFFLWLFYRHQKQSNQPLIEFKLFRNVNFTMGVFAALIATIALVGTELILSQRFQLVLGLSPLEAGLSLLPMALAAFLAAPLTGFLVSYLGSRRIIWMALLTSGIGIGGYLWLHDQTLWQPILCLFVFGLGIGAATTAGSTAVMLNAPAKWAGMAASIEELSYEVGGMLGIAIMGSLMNAIYSTSFILPASLNISSSVQDSLDEALMVAEDLPPQAAEQLISLSSYAFNEAFLVVLKTATILLLVTGAFAWYVAHRTQKVTMVSS